MADALAPLQPQRSGAPKEAGSAEALRRAPGLLSWVTISAEDEAAASKLVRLEHGASSAADYAAHFRAAQLARAARSCRRRCRSRCCRSRSRRATASSTWAARARACWRRRRRRARAPASSSARACTPSRSRRRRPTCSDTPPTAAGASPFCAPTSATRRSTSTASSSAACAARPAPPAMRQLVEKLARPPPAGRPRRRLVTVGFGLELRGASYEGVALTRRTPSARLTARCRTTATRMCCPASLPVRNRPPRRVRRRRRRAPADAKAATDRWAERCKLAGWVRGRRAAAAVGGRASARRRRRACTATGAADDGDGGAAAASICTSRSASGRWAALATAPRGRATVAVARAGISPRGWLPSSAPPPRLRCLDVIMRRPGERDGIAAALACPCGCRLPGDPPPAAV